MFIGGGEPTEFGKPPQEPGLHEIIALIEGAAKPVIAALLHGTIIHTGLEVALACHFRVSVKSARFGVFAGKLGLLPGAGGTQRLPRLLGVEKALQMIVSGETIGADEALRHGLVDEVVEGDLPAAAVADRLCEMGRFGQKTGAGYYTYGADRRATPDPEVEKIIVDVSTRLGITRRPIPDAEIRERLLYPMVNEGAKILEEKIAIRASDIDVIWVHGYGWPIYRGGPMFWADFDQGLPALRDRMLEYGETLGGEHWKPGALLSQLADQGKTFTGYRPTMTYEGLYGPAVRPA